MVMPLYDDNTGRRTVPVVNYLIIAANVIVFVVFQQMGTNDAFTMAYATVPAEIVTGKDIQTEPRERQTPVSDQTISVPGLEPTPIPVYLTLITSMFMHGGLAHIFGNMLFLWIFGDNVEDTVGHVRYLVFYLVTGVLASLSQVFMTIATAGVDSEAARIPSLGASGAISAVLGAYLVLHPKRPVLVLLFRVVTWMPAYVVVGMWFVFQIISALGTLGDRSQLGGVAYAAHVGGFVSGLVLIFPFMIGRERPTSRAYYRR